MGTQSPRFGPPKLAKSRGIKEILPRTPLTLEHQKPQHRDLGGESNGKEPRRVHAYIPHQIPKRKASKSFQENHHEKAPKITKKTNRNNTFKP
jgi:hypothetical protein